jgi:hypothetical protein
MELQMPGIGKVAEEVCDCYMVRVYDEKGDDNDDAVDENGTCNNSFALAKEDDRRYRQVYTVIKEFRKTGRCMEVSKPLDLIVKSAEDFEDSEDFGSFASPKSVEPELDDSAPTSAGPDPEQNSASSDSSTQTESTSEDEDVSEEDSEISNIFAAHNRRADNMIREVTKKKFKEFLPEYKKDYPGTSKSLKDLFGRFRLEYPL